VPVAGVDVETGEILDQTKVQVEQDGADAEAA
jgi:hypothetical protein